MDRAAQDRTQPYRQKKERRLLDALFTHSGSPTWTRTRDLRINSPSLYQLSYQGIVFALPLNKFSSEEPRF
jgi:hypothetical protein